MASIFKRLPVNIVTNASGSCTVVICPEGAFYGAVINAKHYPFLVAGQPNADFPYNLPTKILSPFDPQILNVSTFAVDICNVNYVHTESLLNTKGMITCSVYY